MDCGSVTLLVDLADLGVQDKSELVEIPDAATYSTVLRLFTNRILRIFVRDEACCSSDLDDDDVKARPGRTHVAFDADSRELVQKWYSAAM